MQYMMHKKGV